MSVCVNVQCNKGEADIKRQSEGRWEACVCVCVLEGGGMGPLYACQLSPRTRFP